MFVPSLVDASKWSIVIPWAAGLMAFRRLDGPLMTFFIIVSFAFGTEIITGYLDALTLPNMPAYNVYLFAVFPLWTALLMRWCVVKQVKLVTSIATVCALGSLLYVFRQNPEGVYPWLMVVKSILVACASGAVLLHLSVRTVDNVLTNPKLWIAGSALVYYSITAVLFSLVSTILRSTNGEIARAWDLHSFLNIFTNVFFAVGLLCSLRKANSY